MGGGRGLVSYCRECVVSVHDAHATCPLCGAPLKESGDLSALYPPVGAEVQRLRKQQRTTKGVSISFAGASALCVMLNLVIDSSTLWSLYIAGGLFAAWLFVFLPPHMPRPRTRYVLLLSTVVACAYLLLVSLVTHTPSWFLDWAFPFLLIGAVLVMFVFLLVQKAPLRKSYMPLVWLLLLCLIPLVAALIFRLPAEDAPPALWPTVLAAGCAVVGMMLGFVAARKWWLSELRRKFHI